MLTQFDLDQVLSRVRGNDPHGYFKEAVVNYRSGSYRTCVISTYSAVFMNIFEKLKHAVEVNGTNRSIFYNAHYLREKRSPFEHNLTEELFAAHLISEEQRVYLNELRTQRNEAAHPVGGDWPSGKAAYFLGDAVRLFLSQESLSPNMVMDEIMGRLQGENLFPSGIPASQRAIVATELSRLIPDAYYLFVKRLFEVWGGADVPLGRNISVFVREALSLKNATFEKAVLAMFVRPLLNRLDDEAIGAIVSFVQSSPAWLRNLDATSQSRISQVLVKYVNTAPPHKAAQLFLRIYRVSPSLFEGPLKEMVRYILRANTFDCGLLVALTRRGLARDELVNQFRIKAAGRERQQMLEFLNRHHEEIVENLPGLESYALLLAAAGIDRRGSGELEGISGMLLPRAEAWFRGAPEAASREARRAGVYDPALWFDDTHSETDTERFTSKVA